jgi:hypothetical protein
MGVRVQGLGVRVWFRAQGFGLRVYDFGVEFEFEGWRVWGPEFGVWVRTFSCASANVLSFAAILS